MNIQQFAKLKEGDKIVNRVGAVSSPGTVVAVLPDGVRVRWEPSAPDSPTFFFSVNGTAWFHWELEVDDGGPGAMREMPYGA